MDTIRVHPYHKVNVAALKIDDVEITSTPAELNVLDGVTSTVTELNKLDGVESIAAELDQFILTENITDISTSESLWVVSPYAGTIEAIYSVINGAITDADAGITFKIGGVAVTGGAITITQVASAAGDVDSATPTAANVVTAGQAIEIVVSGASTGTVRSLITFVMQRS